MQSRFALIIGTGLFVYSRVVSTQAEALQESLPPSTPHVSPRGKLQSDYISVVAAESVEQLEGHLSQNDFQNMVVLGTCDDTSVMEVLCNRRFLRLFEIYGEMPPDEAARRSVDLANAKLDAVLSYCSRAKRALETGAKLDLSGLGFEHCNIYEAANASLFLVAKYSPQDLSRLEDRLLIGHRAALAANRDARSNGRNTATPYFHFVVYSNTFWASVYSFALGQSGATEELRGFTGLDLMAGSLVGWDTPQITYPSRLGFVADVTQETHVVERFQIIQLPGIMGADELFRSLIDDLRKAVVSRYPSTDEKLPSLKP